MDYLDYSVCLLSLQATCFYSVLKKYTKMKFILKSIGVSFIILSIVLALFDFLIENKELILLIGLCSLMASYFTKN